MVPSQLATVPYTLSIAYRFLIASVVLFSFGYYKKKLERIKLRDHFWLLIQGAGMYCVAHWMIYNGTTLIPSGVVALTLSLLIIPNTIFGHLLFKDPLSKPFIAGTVISLIGISLVFWNDILKFTSDIDTYKGFGLVFASLIFSSIGTLSSKKIQKSHPYPFFLTNTVAMLYGSLFSFAKHFIYESGKFVFDFSPFYFLPLLYLSLIVTPVAFTIYMRLASDVSAAFASYMWLIMPVIGLNLSFIFEDFNWTIYSILGTLCVMFGGYLSLQNAQKRQVDHKVNNGLRL